MRTAVVRINIDPGAALGADEVKRRMVEMLAFAADAGITVVDPDVAALPATRRELQFLTASDDVPAAEDTLLEACARIFATVPKQGATTYVSRGTNEDALGVLAGFALVGEVIRVPGEEGWDVVTVHLDKADLRRVPESRIQTALEASLNCEVRIVAV